jgi:hypothetical protein
MIICMEPKLNAAAATTNMGTRQEGGNGPSQEFQEAGMLRIMLLCFVQVKGCTIKNNNAEY